MASTRLAPSRIASKEKAPFQAPISNTLQSSREMRPNTLSNSIPKASSDFAPLPDFQASRPTSRLPQAGDRSDETTPVERLGEDTTNGVLPSLVPELQILGL